MENMSQYPLEITGDPRPMVSFRKVRKAYGSLVVLDDLDLDVAAGEMVSIIGPSGSGKTTVLRMLMTLETINSGVIYVDGKPLTHMPKNGKLIPANQRHLRERRADIGMCFQHFNLFPHMTALENCMEGPVQVLGMPKAEARDRSEELLELVGMKGKKDQHPSRLSGGQQQRVAIARALAMRPKVMLFDEVTSALDGICARYFRSRVLFLRWQDRGARPTRGAVREPAKRTHPKVPERRQRGHLGFLVDPTLITTITKVRSKWTGAQSC